MDIVGIAMFMYIVWRGLKDDYDGIGVVALGWLMILAFFVGGKLMGLVLTGLSQGFEWKGWVSVPFEPLGGWFLSVGVASWWAWVNNWKVSQLGEDVIGAVVGLMVWFEVKRLFISFDWKQVVLVLEMIIALIIAAWLGKRYRSIGWYRSGKKGFIFFFLGFLVLELLAVAEMIMGGRAWLVSVEAISGLLFLLGLIMLGREQ
jgi:hypothetical protein